jgi:microcystin-dependent protein
MKFIFKSFVLSVLMIAQVHFAYAQTAALLPNAVQQFFDNNGNPLSSGTVTTYVPNTTTKKTTWQDSGEITAWANPLSLNSAGRPPGDKGIYGDGSYRQVIKDKNGNLIWDQTTTSTGTSGGGGSGDGIAVGTILPYGGLIAPTNYVFAYGEELSRATYGSFLSAITQNSTATCTGGSAVLTSISDTSQLSVGAAVEGSCIPSSSVIISKTSNSVTLNNAATVNTTASVVFFNFGNGNGLTTFNVPDLRGKGVVGRCNMGGASCSNVSATYFGTDPNSVGGNGGSQTSTLVASNLPPYTPAGTVSVTNGAITISGPVITPGSSGIGVTGSSALQTNNNVTLTATQAASSGSFTGTAQGGTSTAFANLPPGIKLYC